MPRIAYVNGRYVPHAQASVHVEDRGYQFADGVYEVCAVKNGRLLDEGPHLDRLDRSLRELRIDPPMARPALRVVLREVMRRNLLRDGLLYFQVTRGVAPRDHAFPAHAASSLVVTARPVDLVKAQARAEEGVRAVTHPDIRWKRCDIKAVALLPNVLAKQAAKEAGGYEAWLVDETGHVTEGSSTNAWIVDTDGNLVTRALDSAILGGITRRMLMQVAQEAGVHIIERPFTVEEAKAAREAFITSATSFVTPVTQIDDAVIGNGRPGSVAMRLRELYIMASEALAQA
ncbi:D-amino-acid transaminase [Futiania mangrovi]|uniref:Probable branched-chain-amino-acid aminotransferase n=1 Tax=Futiania mangrovi TaxID=2959716 RepID=A0A9J6PD80_9PROT|nr:D-amino-acid transaminase [Futiania mangrovii]MCP1335776.1 D-amino-acid transaminase [Futiania mangrovii]